MSDYIKISIKLLWAILMMYWFISGYNSKKTKEQEPLIKRVLFYWFPVFVSMYLLGPGEWFGHTWLRENFVPHSDLVGIIGLSFGATGLGIACWARYTLGRNWSLSVQKKEDHELIANGLYRWIRHPIYTGLLLLFIGTALIVGDYRGILAVIIIFISFWVKLKKEEKWLMQVFGEDYHSYIKQTNALIPYLL
ncbi:isoprenylcysteine carboxylmethyltransferase family protein [Emticicia sp. BO119]|uniref:methyltransferase family protein n=1 Tax=Emticicia sp. BO119 TaxID=2757768 RepID=UPI0015F00B13|nr:isoprenylcysteine carboxylmethyltransferase family protein [Emticicia sp. BO119]MBA4849312.1 isoprenylcysteine carboxylmethyltransferase family protein [Emticicia sp. BO119]